MPTEKKIILDKKAIVEELRKQDEQLRAIFERREALPKKQDATTKSGKCFLTTTKHTILSKNPLTNT